MQLALLAVIVIIIGLIVFLWRRKMMDTKKRAAYHMPVAQPYGQPFYQSVGTFNTAQKITCSVCGRELLPDEMFCAGCGTRRPEPSRAEPDVANQKVFCSGCGRELPPDENFCCVCGMHRQNPLPDETSDL